MKFQLSRRQLLEVLTPIQAIIPARTTLPILHNLKLTAEKGKLLFEATDLDVCLSRSVGATVRSEGSLLVPAKRLYDVVRELPDLEVKVEQTDLTLVVACERSVFKLPAINTEDYPKVPEPAEGDSVKKVRLGVSSLLRAVDKVSFAISTDENRDGRPSSGADVVRLRQLFCKGIRQRFQGKKIGEGRGGSLRRA